MKSLIINSFIESSYLYSQIKGEAEVGREFRKKLQQFILKNKDKITDQELVKMNFWFFFQISQDKTIIKNEKNLIFLIKAMFLSGSESDEKYSYDASLKIFDLAKNIESKERNLLFANYGKYLNKKINLNYISTLEIFKNLDKKIKEAKLNIDLFPNQKEDLILINKLFNKNSKYKNHYINMGDIINSLILLVDEQFISGKKAALHNNIQQLINEQLQHFGPIELKDNSHHSGMPVLVSRAFNSLRYVINIYDKNKKEEIEKSCINICKMFRKAFSETCWEKSLPHIEYLSKAKPGSLENKLYYELIVPESNQKKLMKI